MTQEDKEKLLLRYLCTILPYRVKVQYKGAIKEIQYIEPEFGELCLAYPDNTFTVPVVDCKPYLRPMSSMAKEELFEVQDIIGKGVEIRDGFIYIVDSSINSFTYLELKAVFEWFNTHHFDYLGLIEKGIALEAPEGMY